MGTRKSSSRSRTRKKGGMRVGDWLSCVRGQGGDERDDQYNRGEGRRLDD